MLELSGSQHAAHVCCAAATDAIRNVGLLPGSSIGYREVEL